MSHLRILFTDFHLTSDHEFRKTYFVFFKIPMIHQFVSKDLFGYLERKLCVELDCYFVNWARLLLLLHALLAVQIIMFVFLTREYTKR